MGQRREVPQCVRAQLGWSMHFDVF